MVWSIIGILSHRLASLVASPQISVMSSSAIAIIRAMLARLKSLLVEALFGNVADGELVV